MLQRGGWRVASCHSSRSSTATCSRPFPGRWTQPCRFPAKARDREAAAAFVQVQEVRVSDDARPTIDVVFTAAMEIESKISDGSIVDAVELWSYRHGQVSLAADQFSYDPDLQTLTWTATSLLWYGFYELRLDGLQLFACEGSLLQGGARGLQFQLPAFGAEQPLLAGEVALEVENYSVPSLVDWNSDELPDLIVGEKTDSGLGKVRIYLNQGTASSPLFTTFTYAQQGSSDLSVPASGCLGVFPRVADWNGDRKKDLVVGRADGKIQVFLNVNTDAEPLFGDPAYVMVGQPGAKTDISLGVRATLEIVDWNEDGRLDLVTGALDGKVRVFLNEGATGAPDFRAVLVVQDGGVDLVDPTGRSSVAVADLNGDGRKDLLVGNTVGELRFYANVGSNVEPAFDGSVPIEAGGAPIDLPGTPRSRPFVGDFNGDGSPDLLVGAEDGLVRVYLLTSWINPTVRPVETGQPGGEYVYFFLSTAGIFQSPGSWHHTELPMDVDFDQAITWSDVTRMLGELNNPVFHDQTGYYLTTFPDDVEPCLWDVNGDDLFTPLDTLLIINYLNAAAGEGEAAVGGVSFVPFAPLPCYADQTAQRSSESLDAACDVAADAQWCELDWIGVSPQRPAAAATSTGERADEPGRLDHLESILDVLVEE